MIAAVATFLIVDCYNDLARLRGAAGALILILIGWIFSVHPDKVRWRPIIWGHSIQFVFALIALRLVDCSFLATLIEYYQILFY